jgi:tRNA U34 5-methylaminomethyl-2-thiouridine-forming methyltransferase MnmC
MSNLELIITSDGSHSLLNKAMDETYHSRHGAMQESLHVFIRHGLEFVLAMNLGGSIRILEIGFGTGLNAMLTAQHSSVNSITVEYSSLEAFPVEEALWSKLNYSNSPATEKLFTQLHRAEWDSPIQILPNFTLIKRKATLQAVDLGDKKFDLVFYDAFAPNKQPEMWELPVLDKVTHKLNTGGVFVTYCAKGQLKRDLRSLGFEVETLSGPPGKKEMIRATKISGSKTQISS